MVLPVLVAARRAAYRWSLVEPNVVGGVIVRYNTPVGDISGTGCDCGARLDAKLPASHLGTPEEAPGWPFLPSWALRRARVAGRLLHCALSF